MSSYNFTDIKNLQSTFNQLSSYGIDIPCSSQINSYMNCIFEVGTLIDSGATETQKTLAIQNLIEITGDALFKLLKKVLKNDERVTATKDVKNTAKKAEKLNTKSQELGVKMEGNFNETAKSVDKQTRIIKDAGALLIAVEDEIKAEQEKIQEVIEKIEEEKKKLEDPKLDKDEQLEILGTINTLTGELTAITEAIFSKQDTLLNLKSAVDDATNDIANATAQMQANIENGKTEMAQIAQEGADATSDLAKDAKNGGENKKNEVILNQAANATATNGITAVASVELKQAALQEGGAATTRLTSITDNSKKIETGLRNLGDDGKILNHYTNTIGSAIKGFTDQVGSWNTALPPVIEGIGSAINIEAENGMLKEFVASDIETLNSNQEDNESQDIKSEEQISEKQNNNEDTNNENDAPEKSKLVNGLVTPTFQFSKKSFGI